MNKQSAKLFPDYIVGSAFLKMSYMAFQRITVSQEACPDVHELIPTTRTEVSINRP